MYNNKRYNIYLNNNISLAQNMIIKLDILALLFDKYVYEMTGLNAYLDSLENKKYYLNLSGEYHSLDEYLIFKKINNNKIIIKSLDTGNDIEFTKQNLEINKATKKAYTFDSRYFKELISIFPEQELLIRGIILPTDINKIINSKNGTILNYPSQLIEDNEYDLLSKIQDWIYNHVNTYLNEGYAAIDNLYIASYITIFTNSLFTKLLNTRLSFCKTNQVHSYHLNEYLLSFGIPANILDYLTFKQKMFFYKNIRFIRKNNGKNEILEKLIKNTLTERNIPIYEIKENHNVSVINNNNILPDLLFKRLPKNEIAEPTTLIDYEFDELLNKTNSLTKDNEEYNSDNKNSIKEKLIYSNSNTIQTKLLECNTVDLSNSLVFTFENTLLNHWIYMSYNDLYNVNVLINLSKNNSSFNINSKQAIAIYQYCVLKAYCIENYENEFINLQILPIFINRVLAKDKPSFNLLKEKISSIYITDDILHDVYDNSIDINQVITTTIDFSNLCINVYINANLEYNKYSKLEDINARAELANFVENLYITSIIEPTSFNSLNEVITYKQLIDDIGIDFTDYTTENYLELANLLFNSFTLLQIKETEKLSNIQKAMIDLLKKFSSYSINLINEINTEPVTIIPRASCRVNVKNENKVLNYYIDSAKTNILNNKISTIYYSPLLIESVITDKNNTVNFKDVDHILNSVNYESLNNNLFKREIPIKSEIKVNFSSNTDFTTLPEDIKMFFLNLDF